MTKNELQKELSKMKVAIQKNCKECANTDKFCSAERECLLFPYSQFNKKNIAKKQKQNEQG